jgi:HlyD family secretion protein
MKKTVYIIIALVGVLALAAILYLVLSPRSSSTTLSDEIETTQIDIGPVSEIVGATGKVSSDQSALLSWKTSGLVADTYVQVGDQVQAGDVLAILDPGSLSPLDILAQAELVAARRALDNLIESQTQAALAYQSVETARQALDDARSPVVDQSSALQAVADAEKAVADAERRLKTITAPVSQAALDQAQANLVLKEKKLDDNQGMIDRIQKKLNKRDDQYKPWESRRRYRQIMDGLEIQRTQLEIDYENSLQKYENLISPQNFNDVSVAEADLLGAKARLLEAERAWQRIAEGVSLADLALLEAQLADAQREYERVRDGPTAQDITAAQARVTAAQGALEKAQLLAPFDGTITDVISKPNDLVSPGTLAFRLDDLSSLSVDVGISEIDINLIEVGQPVILTFDAILARQYNGRVVEVSPVGSTSLGIVDFMVKVELTDADADVRPGMTAAVEIIIKQTGEALRVPNRAAEGTSFVYQIDRDGNLVLTIGISSDQYSQVLVGDLSPGDVIVLNPYQL